jgi:Na+-driven multidrug efflux pump
MAAIDQIVFALNTSGTLAIGTVCFFIVYTTFKGIEDTAIQEFSKRFMMAIAVLILYVSYFMTYNSFFQNSAIARYPMYLLLVAVFLYMIYAAVAFEKVADQYGISQNSKLKKMSMEEGTGQ